jgi:peptide-methionine (S)-S-oxide reductase
MRASKACTSYRALLDWYWRIHDPTSVDKQGADEGPEYRSVIFVHSADQRAAAEASRTALARTSPAPIVTAIESAGNFRPAADEHQDYYARNRAGAYCQEVIAPHLRAAGLAD